MGRFTYTYMRQLAATTGNKNMNANNENITQRTASTKLHKDAQPVKTVLTLDWSNMDRAALIALATKPAVIARQADYRAEGTIPEADTVDVHELVNRERKARGPRDPKRDAKAYIAQRKAEGATLEEIMEELEADD